MTYYHQLWLQGREVRSIASSHRDDNNARLEAARMAASRDDCDMIVTLNHEGRPIGTALRPRKK